MIAFPKIELHVHLEGTVQPQTVLAIARRNRFALPVDTPEELAALYEFRDFNHFIEIFELQLGALQRGDDFRQIVVEYAAEAASHSAVYIEAIFAPGLWRGLDTDEVFSGYCDGAQEARETYGVEVRLTPDIPRVYSPEEAETTVQYAVKYRSQGVVGVGLAGPEGHPSEPFARAFALARDGGLGSVPHAGEVTGPESVWDALEALRPDRIRHGIRAADDAALLRELRERGIVLDVTPVSNVRTGAVRSIDEHPLPRLVGAGIPCTVSTDDPAMFDTDLSREYEVARSLGVSPRAAYEAGVEGALCDEATRARLRAIGDEFDWDALENGAVET